MLKYDPLAETEIGCSCKIEALLLEPAADCTSRQNVCMIVRSFLSHCMSPERTEVYKWQGHFGRFFGYALIFLASVRFSSNNF